MSYPARSEGLVNMDKRKKKTILENLGSELYQTRTLLETNFYGKNLLKGMNNWVVGFVKHLGPFLIRTTKELRQMN